jgi:hypothetical protein
MDLLIKFATSLECKTGSLQTAELYLTPEDTRRVGKPHVKWLESVEEGLKNMGLRNWRRE